MLWDLTQLRIAEINNFDKFDREGLLWYRIFFYCVCVIVDWVTVFLWLIVESVHQSEAVFMTGQHILQCKNWPYKKCMAIMVKSSTIQNCGYHHSPIWKQQSKQIILLGTGEIFFLQNNLVLIFSRDPDLNLTSPHGGKKDALVRSPSSKKIPYSDNMQMFVQTLYSECADVLNVHIKSVTTAHVFLLILPTWGRAIIQSAASLVSHMC